jgi:hypothetical protein
MKNLLEKTRKSKKGSNLLFIRKSNKLELKPFTQIKNFIRLKKDMTKLYSKK